MDSFQQILKTLIGMGYKKADITNKLYMKHFVAFYYFLKRRNL